MEVLEEVAAVDGIGVLVGELQLVSLLLLYLLAVAHRGTMVVAVVLIKVGMVEVEVEAQVE
jgi:hypothetical protein